ncbi:hypothetical protein SH580_01615 [Coraliomargarita algicola]|uniref:GHMP kinase C-terminal domain-containing protein n=1 Tax=Coraliomargarita algicola TaxID=3092156 RepID=A0ABZ0RMR8_9BACT|nr:hypothetical protein [Coraliomargarita sp. J2-16]WPJ96398.1 hypothetical protein SH580_01615 [Coraliomargarita sp. J2-16]
MNQLTDDCLSQQALLELAADLGSDCPFFIDAQPTLMSGRGEVLHSLAPELADCLRGRPVILFKPEFGIHTAWAYRQLIQAQPAGYEPEAQATERLEQFRETRSTDSLLFNSFEAVVGKKYLAIHCLLNELRARGIRCLMSGSGSCCFALPKDEAETDSIRSICHNALGSGIFFIETSIR